MPFSHRPLGYSGQAWVPWVALHLVHSGTRSPSQPREPRKSLFCLQSGDGMGSGVGQTATLVIFPLPGLGRVSVNRCACVLQGRTFYALAWSPFA
ncbi:hypothetical protein CI102_12311 [Trichoderma harzianum]|nr:hypothetical protein CI102_12311 [Trichoderma harzianum]